MLARRSDRIFDSQDGMSEQGGKRITNTGGSCGSARGAEQLTFN